MTARSCRCGPTVARPAAASRAAVGAQAARQGRPASQPSSAMRGAGELVFGRVASALVRARRRCARARRRSPSPCSAICRFERRQPGRVGARSARRAACCGRASPLRSATQWWAWPGSSASTSRSRKRRRSPALAREQPVHRRRQPQHRQPFAQRIDRGRRAVDADLPPFGRGRQGAGADLDRRRAARRPRTRPRPSRRAISRQRRAAQARGPGLSSETASSTLVLPAPLSPDSRTKPGPGLDAAPRGRSGNR